MQRFFVRKRRISDYIYERIFLISEMFSDVHPPAVCGGSSKIRLMNDTNRKNLRRLFFEINDRILFNE